MASSLHFRIVLLHGDPAVQRQLSQPLASTADLTIHPDLTSALAAIEGGAAPLVIAEAQLVAREQSGFERLRASGATLAVWAVAAAQDERLLAEALATQADDVLVLPLPSALLVEKVRAFAGLVERLAERSQRVSGALGADGVLPLMKLCEDQRVTGRLTVTTQALKAWVDFLGGEVTRVVCEPERAGEEPLDTLLALTAGAYTIARRALDAPPTKKALEVAPAEARSAPVVELPPPLVSEIAFAAHRTPVTIKTSVDNRPNCTVTTTVLRGNLILQKTRTSWHKPLQDEADLDQARAQLVRQHARMAAKIREMVASEAPRVPPPAQPTGAVVDASLMTWAVHLIAEQAWTYLGTTITAKLLRRSLAKAHARHDVLRVFRVNDDARVEVALAPGSRLAAVAVEAVAEWLAAFLAEGIQVQPEVAHLQPRQATVLMEHALEKVGFFRAYQQVAERLRQQGVRIPAA
jgi:DNA-binding response OmpR family regulator